MEPGDADGLLAVTDYCLVSWARVVWRLGRGSSMCFQMQMSVTDEYELVSSRLWPSWDTLISEMGLRSRLLGDVWRWRKFEFLMNIEEDIYTHWKNGLMHWLSGFCEFSWGKVTPNCLVLVAGSRVPLPKQMRVLHLGCSGAGGKITAEPMGLQSSPGMVYHVGLPTC